jgi:hypothetical protein
MRLSTRISLLSALALSLPLASSTLQAQSCLGYPSFSANHLQMNAGASFSSDFEQFGANFVSGSNTIFAGLGVGGTRNTGSNSSLEARGLLGSQVPVGQSARWQICPVLNASYGTGPDDLALPGNDVTTAGAGFGLALGGELSRSETLAIVPSFQLGFQYERINIEGLGGETLTDTYGTVGVGVGFVFSNQLSLRPSVTIPTREGSNEPIFGISVALNYGRRR